MRFQGEMLIRKEQKTLEDPMNGGCSDGHLVGRHYENSTKFYSVHGALEWVGFNGAECHVFLLLFVSEKALQFSVFQTINHVIWERILLE